MRIFNTETIFYGNREDRIPTIGFFDEMVGDTFAITSDGKIIYSEFDIYQFVYANHLRDKERSYVGGIQECILANNSFRIVLSEKAAEHLSIPKETKFTLTKVQRRDFVQELEKILGQWADKPHLRVLSLVA